MYVYPHVILSTCVLICAFLQPLEIFVDDETKLTLHGLQQYYLKLEESQKNRKLNDLLDTLDFNQVRTFIHPLFTSGPLIRTTRSLFSSSRLLVRLSSTSFYANALSRASPYILISTKKNGRTSCVPPGGPLVYLWCSIARYTQFKNFEKRILVATDIFGRGIDVERVNIVINYDTPGDADSYLHRVGYMPFLPCFWPPA